MDYRLKSIYENMLNNKAEIREAKSLSLAGVYTKLIVEATKLSYSEFAKPQTSKRKDRKQIFLTKYENGEPFSVIKNNIQKEVIFSKDPQTIQAIKNLHVGDPDKTSAAYKNAKAIYDNIRLFDSANNKDAYSLNDLIKTGEFSGQGSGAGADNTTLNEASVCLWAAVYQQIKNASYEIVKQNANKVTSFFNVDEDLNKMLSQTDNLWIEHYKNVAEYLFKHILSKDKYVFHRGSVLVKAIYSKFAQLNKISEDPFANSNKWNPADIWAVNVNMDEGDFLAKLNSTKTIVELNDLLKMLFSNKQLIGISLKKTEKTVHSQEYNTPVSNPTATFLTSNPGSGTKGIFAKDVYIKGSYSFASSSNEDYVIQFRSFNPWSDFQGEIKGKTANLGKVAHGVLNRILRKNGVEELPGLNHIRNIATNKSSNSSLLKEMYDIFLSLHGVLPQDVKSVDDYIAKAQNSSVVSEDYVFSKYFGLKLLKILDLVDNDVKDKIMSNIIAYALSSTQTSGPFVKIY